MSRVLPFFSTKTTNDKLSPRQNEYVLIYKNCATFYSGPELLRTVSYPFRKTCVEQFPLVWWIFCIGIPMSTLRRTMSKFLG